MANAFSVGRSTRDDLTVLTLEGFLDAHTAPDFEAAIEKEIDDGHLRLIVDGAGLTYISSAGLGVFMGFIEDVRDGGGDIKICGLIPKVKEVFSLLGFEELFDVVDDVDSAAACFTTSPGGKV